jgi:hypothetical protein
MVPNLNSVITILLLGTPALILIVFLPAIIELKKPKDGGPRMITIIFQTEGLHQHSSFVWQTSKKTICPTALQSAHEDTRVLAKPGALGVCLNRNFLFFHWSLANARFP